MRYRPTGMVVAAQGPPMGAVGPMDLRGLVDIGWSDWGTAEAIERTLALLAETPPWRRRRSAAAA